MVYVHDDGSVVCSPHGMATSGVITTSSDGGDAMSSGGGLMSSGGATTSSGGTTTSSGGATMSSGGATMSSGGASGGGGMMFITFISFIVFSFRFLKFPKK